MHLETTRIRQLWQRITRRTSARTLESELARVVSENSRLRDENRALLNSILGIAGIPPVYSTSAEDPRSLLSPGAGSGAPAPEPVSPSAANVSARRAAEHRKHAAQLAPLRRRSWPQINRALEFKASRKTPQMVTED